MDLKYGRFYGCYNLTIKYIKMTMVLIKDYVITSDKFFSSTINMFINNMKLDMQYPSVNITIK